MNQDINGLPEVHAPHGEISLVDCFVTVSRHKKFIIGFTLVASLIAAAVSMVLPPVYRAEVTLLPPQQAQSGAAALISQLGGAAGMMAGAAGVKSPNDMYIGILKSRTIADSLLNRFQLADAYGTKSVEAARILLAEKTTIGAGKDGLITIYVEHDDKKRVADLANAYVDELTKLTTVLAVTEASQRRMFYERQLKLAKDNLAAAESRLKRALETGGVVSVDSDSRAIVENVGRIRARISAKEIELNSMKAFVTENNSEYKRAREELNSLRGEFRRLESGNGIPDVKPNGDQSGLQSIKVLRDVKYYQMLYELLAKQYEMARLDEAQDGAVIQILDRAIEPEGRYKPKRAVLVLLTAVISLFLSIALVLGRDALRRIRS